MYDVFVPFVGYSTRHLAVVVTMGRHEARGVRPLALGHDLGVPSVHRAQVPLKLRQPQAAGWHLTRFRKARELGLAPRKSMKIDGNRRKSTKNDGTRVKIECGARWVENFPESVGRPLELGTTELTGRLGMATINGPKGSESRFLAEKPPFSRCPEPRSSPRAWRWAAPAVGTSWLRSSS